MDWLIDFVSNEKVLNTILFLIVCFGINGSIRFLIEKTVANSEACYDLKKRVSYVCIVALIVALVIIWTQPSNIIAYISIFSAAGVMIYKDVIETY